MKVLLSIDEVIQQIKYIIFVSTIVRKKPYIKSLGQTDRVKALTKARLIYQDLQGKIERGERLKELTTKQLVEIHLQQ